MKKVTAIVLALIMILAISACGNQTGSSSNDDNQADNATNNDVATGNASAANDDYFIWSEEVEGQIDGLTELGKKQKNLVIPEKCTGFYFAALKESENLESISFLNDDTELSESLLRECPNLKEVKLPKNIKKIPDKLLYNCESLITIDIPETVEEIGRYSFERCQKLESISLKSGLKTIKKYAFRECASIKKVSIPDTVKEIQTSAFDGCTSITEIVFEGNNVETIEEYAFANCKSLYSLIIPEGVRSIGHNFIDFSPLEEIYLPESLTDIDPLAFVSYNNLPNLTIYVKEGSYADIHFEDTIQYLGMHTKAYY